MKVKGVPISITLHQPPESPTGRVLRDLAIIADHYKDAFPPYRKFNADEPIFEALRRVSPYEACGMIETGVDDE